MNSKKYKKFFLIFCVLIFSIFMNIGYASVVAENDGSTFVTKEEFELLKKNFNKQISDYNKSIDGKIDGAIAEYLAGIGLGGRSSVEICKTNLSYPLTLRMLGPYNGNNVRNISTLDVGTKLWTDDYEVLLYGTWNHVMFYTKENIKKNPNNVIKNFYNGKILSGKYYINNMHNNYNVKAFMNTNILQSGNKKTAIDYTNYKMAAFFDMNAFCPTGTHNAAANTWDRKDLIYATNTRKLILPTDVCPIIWDEYMNWNTTTNIINLSTTDGIDKKWNVCAVSAGGTGYRMTNQNKTSWTQQASFNDGKINDIFCGSVSSNVDTDLYVPVLYDGKIHITNVNTTKMDLQPVAVLCNTWHGSSGTRNKNSVNIEHLIEPGYVVEPESNVAGATWENASLIKGTRCYYNEIWPVSGTNVECCLTDGIPLCEMEKDAQTFIVKFTPTWTDFLGDTGKKIMFSKEPITETTFTPDTSPNSDKYIDISNTEKGAKAKYLVLNNGVDNVIYFDNLNKGDKLYYKITWETGQSTNDENYKKTVMIQEPECTVIYAD